MVSTVYSSWNPLRNKTGSYSDPYICREIQPKLGTQSSRMAATVEVELEAPKKLISPRIRTS